MCNIMDKQVKIKLLCREVYRATNIPNGDFLEDFVIQVNGVAIYARVHAQGYTFRLEFQTDLLASDGRQELIELTIASIDFFDLYDRPIVHGLITVNGATLHYVTSSDGRICCISFAIPDRRATNSQAPDVKPIGFVFSRLDALRKSSAKVESDEDSALFFARKMFLLAQKESNPKPEQKCPEFNPFPDFDPDYKKDRGMPGMQAFCE